MRTLFLTCYLFGEVRILEEKFKAPRYLAFYRAAYSLRVWDEMYEFASVCSLEWGTSDVVHRDSSNITTVLTFVSLSKRTCARILCRRVPVAAQKRTQKKM